MKSLDSRLYAFSTGGIVKWTVNEPFIYSPPAIGDDGTVYVESNDHRLYGIAPLGKSTWTILTSRVVNYPPALAADGTIYISSSDLILCAINPNGS